MLGLQDLLTADHLAFAASDHPVDRGAPAAHAGAGQLQADARKCGSQSIEDGVVAWIATEPKASLDPVFDEFSPVVGVGLMAVFFA